MRSVIALAFVMAGASAAHAGTGNSNCCNDIYSPIPEPHTAAIWPDPHVSTEMLFVSEMRALHMKGLKVQAEDGGTLSPEHRRALQKKLDNLQARYRDMP